MARTSAFRSRRLAELERRGEAAVTGAAAVPRLHVDQDEAGVYVYRLVDPVTGLVLGELPRTRVDALTLEDVLTSAWTSQAA